MGANIYWIPISNAKKSLNVSTPSRFVSAMRRAFGDSTPWRLGPEDVSKLQGMGATWDSGERPNPFDTLVDAILHEDEPRVIEVWPEYQPAETRCPRQTPLSTP